MAIWCPYCCGKAKLVDGTVIYPHRPDLASKRFWQCAPCDAYVGCVQDSDTALGRLANKDLRRAKQQAHAALDPLWQDGAMTRSDAYAWLAKQLKIPPSMCHIGMFTVELCERVVEVCLEREGFKVQYGGQ